MSKAKGKAEAEDIMYKNRGISIEEDNIRKYTAPAYRAAEVERKTMLFDKVVLTFGWKKFDSHFLPFLVLDVGICSGGNL